MEKKCCNHDCNQGRTCPLRTSKIIDAVNQTRKDMSEIRYFDAMRTSVVGPAPCEQCLRTIECELDEKACQSFDDYVEKNKFDKNKPRIPTHEMYMKIFEEDEGQLSLL
jgi:hypothetical protein